LANRLSGQNNHGWQTMEQRMVDVMVKVTKSTDQTAIGAKAHRAVAKHAIRRGVFTADDFLKRQRRRVTGTHQLLPRAVRDQDEFTLPQHRRFMETTVDRDPTLAVDHQMESYGLPIGRHMNAPAPGEVGREVDVTTQAKPGKHFAQKVH
jgi:hypothetical protein